MCRKHSRESDGEFSTVAGIVLLIWRKGVQAGARRACVFGATDGRPVRPERTVRRSGASGAVFDLFRAMDLKRIF